MIQLSKDQFDEFVQNFKNTNPQHLRLGQAFHQFFKLEKVDTNRTVHDKLYQRDGQEAMKMIMSNFEFV